MVTFDYRHFQVLSSLTLYSSHYRDFTTEDITMPREIITLQLGQCGNQSKSETAIDRAYFRLFLLCFFSFIFRVL